MRRLYRAPVKEGLLLLYLAADAQAILARIDSIGLSPALLVYVALFGLLAAGLWVASRLASAWLRCAFAIIAFAAAAFLSASERILGDHLGYDGYLTLMGSAGFAGDALAQHGGRIAAGIGIAALLALAIALPPRRRPRLRPRWALVPPGALALLTALLFARGGDGARGLPGAYVPLAYAILAGGEAAAQGGGARRPVTMRPMPPPGTGDIVLIVDESVAARYLDLTDVAGVRSGLLDPPAGIAVANFGVAAAITNCSYGTNVTLRHGGTRERYMALNATGPSIWAYARRAGYVPVYLDAQRTGGGFQNGMHAGERDEIARFVQFDSVPVESRDQAAAALLAKLLANGRREFVLVNKVGAHFPVHDKYPDSHARYMPALPRGRYRGIADTGSRAGFDGSPAQWRLYRNAYRNTLLWNVGGFFDRVLAAGTLHGATLVYTSDHGQTLGERGGWGVHTHCSARPQDEEGAVPLAVLTDARAAGWAGAATRNRDRASHYQIFPTLLTLMGYPPAAIRGEYGETLEAPLKDELRFNTLFNARLGRKPEWQRIDSAALPHPPASDWQRKSLPPR